MRVTRIEVPDIGDYKNIPVIEVLVGVGQRVEREQSLVVLESDKATMDVPSPTAGVIKEMKVAVGETVSQGTLIALLDSDGERQDDAAPVPAAASAARDLACPSANVATGLVAALAPAPELNSASAPLHHAPAREGECRADDGDRAADQHVLEPLAKQHIELMNRWRGVAVHQKDEQRDQRGVQPVALADVVRNERRHDEG